MTLEEALEQLENQKALTETFQDRYNQETQKAMTKEYENRVLTSRVQRLEAQVVELGSIGMPTNDDETPMKVVKESTRGNRK